MDSKESKRPETVVKATGGGGVVVVKPTPARRPNLNPNKAALIAREVALAAPNGGSNSEALNLGGGYSGSRASFAERLATRSDGTGRPPTGKPSNTARFKTMTLSHLCSPCIAIPPGVSPSTLLDSPVLLSSQKAEPSPTTGTFPLPPILLESSPATPVSDSTEGKPPPPPDQDGSPEFEFKPFPKPSKRNSSPPALGSLGMFGISHQQDLAQTQTLVLTSPSSVNPPKLVAPLQFIKPPPEPRLQPPLLETVEKPVPAQRSISTSPSASPIADKTQLALPTLLTERPSDDGFNWRKYGQKQVKGCEFPRSYYKCTHIGCPVKRKVERSPDGQVTEIIYKGDHNHAKPQATRRMSVGASHLLDAVGAGVSREISRLAIAGKANDNSVNTKNEDDSLFTTKKRLVPYSGGPTGSPEHSVTSTSEDEAEDREDSKVEDVVDREPNSKRRKNDKSEEMVVVTAPLRTIREPRVVLQTTSDVDILDDGYRWRKYGQKVVKGNPHQRSYYKCKNMGCPVRKHVERSATDPKAVITTYEGKHNHDAPVGRNSHLATTSSTGGNPIQLSPNNVTKPSSSLHDQYFYRN